MKYEETRLALARLGKKQALAKRLIEKVSAGLLTTEDHREVLSFLCIKFKEDDFIESGSVHISSPFTYCDVALSMVPIELKFELSNSAVGKFKFVLSCHRNYRAEAIAHTPVRAVMAGIIAYKSAVFSDTFAQRIFDRDRELSQQERLKVQVHA